MLMLCLSILLGLVMPIHAAEQNQPAEDATANAEDNQITPDRIRAMRSTAEQDPSLSEEVRKEVLALYDGALTFLSDAEQANARRQLLIERGQKAPEWIEQLDAEIEKESNLKPENLDQLINTNGALELATIETKVQQIELEYQKAKTDLDDSKKNRNQVESEPQERATQRTKFEQRAAELKGLINQPNNGEGIPARQQAREVNHRAEQIYIDAQLAMFDQERTTQEIRLKWRTAQYRLADLKANRLASSLEAWRKVLRQRQADQVANVRQQLETLRPALAEAGLTQRVEDVSQLLDYLTEMREQTDQLLEQRQRLEQQADDIGDRYTTSLEQVRKFGQDTSILGPTLRRDFAALPDVRDLQEQAGSRRDALAKMSQYQTQWERRLKDLRDIDEELDRVLKRVPVSKVDDSLRQALTQVLTLEKQQLVNVNQASQRVNTEIANLEATRARLIAITNTYEAFIKERLLWTRDAPAFHSPLNLSRFQEAVSQVYAPGISLHVLGDLADSIRFLPTFWISAVAGFLLLFVLVRVACRKHQNWLDQPNLLRSTSMIFTLLAVVKALAGSLLIGLLIALPGLGLRLSAESSGYSGSVGDGLITAGALYFLLRSLHRTSRESGLGQAHFRWPRGARNDVRKTLHLAVPLLIPLIALIVFCESRRAEPVRYIFGRGLLMVTLLLLAAFAAYLFRPNGPVVNTLKRGKKKSWLYQLRYVWYLPLLLLLVGLVPAAWAGYHDTSMQAGAILLQTAITLLIVLFFYNLAMRWLVITQRKIVLAEARRRQEAEQADNDSGQTDLPTFDDNEGSIDLSEVGDQSGQLVSLLTAALAILLLVPVWSPLVPALTPIFEQPVWQFGDGNAVTLANLLWGLIAGIITYALVRNLSGVMELILSNFEMTPGGRYALINVVKYTVIAVGIVLVVNSLGFAWSRLQWLIAALGVGLGFGLQEIVANFVSGLIILIERPIRVGDTVTVGNVNGTVTRIRIRATTIRDWDQKELIVPNKEFITGQLINWSLTDAITRLTVNVGVAYGSDVAKTEEILLNAARNHPDVFNSPPPRALFLGFGDNSLNFTLFVFTDTIDKRLSLLHDLHKAIDKGCREAGVEIAFPQRDVHLDVKEGLDIRLMRKTAKQADSST